MAKIRLPDFPVAGPSVRFDDDMLVFDTQPDDFMPVVRAWRAGLDPSSSNRG